MADLRQMLIDAEQNLALLLDSFDTVQPHEDQNETITLAYGCFKAAYRAMIDAKGLTDEMLDLKDAIEQKIAFRYAFMQGYVDRSIKDGLLEEDMRFARILPLSMKLYMTGALDNRSPGKEFAQLQNSAILDNARGVLIFGYASGAHRRCEMAKVYLGSLASI